MIALCASACEEGLTQARDSFPDAPECQECENDDDCSGNLVCSSRFRCVECETGAECPDGFGCSGGRCLPEGTPTDDVDLLFVVDNSNSMAQEQQNFVVNFPILLQGLLDPAAEGQSPSALHVGVISTDLGTASYGVTTCEDFDGDDGALLHDGSGAGCGDAYPTFLSWEEGDNRDQLAADFGCIASLGTSGCGFEQHFGAVQRALVGHADNTNAGFLREGSLLAVVFLTDEDDCTVRMDDPSAVEILDPDADLGSLNLRCFRYGDDYVWPLADVASALLALRPDRPDRIVTAGIVGVPPYNSCNVEGMATEDFDCLLDLAAMQERIDNSAEGRGERLIPSCDVAGLGEAFPPRRIVGLVRAIHEAGGGGTIGSICEPDFGPAAQRIGELIRSRL